MEENAKPTGTVLVVEDNDFVRMQLLKFLAEDGYSVIEARSGKQALELFGPHVTILVTDVRMDPVSGFELVRKLRAQGEKTPVVFVTADHDPDMLGEATKLGVTGVLMKPVQKARLLEMVHRAIVNLERAKK